MTKILVFALLAVAVYWFLRAARRAKPKAQDGRRHAAAEAMVPCARCGVNVPRSEALESRGSFFCSEEHRALGVG